MEELVQVKSIHYQNSANLAINRRQYNYLTSLSKVTMCWYNLLVFSECDGLYYGEGCKTPCNCGAGVLTCDKVLGCQCKTGWAGAKCDADIDECASGNPCSGANQVCQNTPGSYRCICEAGYNETTPGNCTGLLFK